MCLDRHFEILEGSDHPESIGARHSRCPGCVQGGGCLDWLTLSAIEGNLLMSSDRVEIGGVPKSDFER